MKSTTVSNEFNEGLSTINKENKDKTVANEVPNSSEKLDGGYGYVIVLASFLMQACSFGVISGFGVFLEHYRSEVFPGQETSQIALIGTVAPTTVALASVFTGRLCDKLGFRVCGFLGLILVILSYITASFATKIWHLIVTQGFLFGLGGALLYVPANTVVTRWFVKYRGLAVGVGTAGSGVGGLIASVVNASLFSKLSLSSILRINSLVIGILLLFSAVVIRSPRVSSIKINSPVSSQSNSFRITLVLNPKFILFFTSMFFGGFGYLIPLYYIPLYAKHIGLSKDQGAFVVGAINIASGFGRIIIGLLGDHIGHVRMFFLCMSSSFLLLILWFFSNNFTILLVFAILYGFASGGFAGGFPSTCAELFGEVHLATLMGIAYAPTGLGDLFGPFIAGLILDANHQNYHYVIYYTMGLYGMSALSLICIILLQLRTKPAPIVSF